MPVTSFEQRVIYGDTDQSGVVYHANFIRWFEAARCEYLRERGGSYGEITKHGVHFPVVEVVCRYHKPVRFEDRVVVDVEVTEMKRVTLRFEYRVHLAGETELLAEGYTVHGCIGAEGRLMRIPDDVRKMVLGG